MEIGTSGQKLFKSSLESLKTSINLNQNIMKILWGALVVDGRGKLGGHVAAKNRSGAYLRTKVTPVNPQTSFQTAVRNLFGSLSQAWSGLTQQVRDGWDGAVDAWQTTNIFGNIKTPTGKNLYLRLNSLAQQAGWPAIAVAPPKAAMPDDVITGVAFDITLDTITLTDASTDATVRYMVFATPSLSQGTSFVKNQLRLIEAFQASAALPATLHASYLAKYGEPLAGANVHFAFKKVLDNGQASPLQIIKSVVAA